MSDEEEYDPLHPSQTLKLFGHVQAEKTLLNAYNSKRLHHAWLISGEKGLGKATLAYIFARFILTRPPEDGADGLFGDALEAEEASSLEVDENHPMFDRLLAGGHGNLRVVARRYDEKKKKIPDEILVDQIRELAGFFGQTAAEGGWRIAIIDSADELNRNAANALLKMLEEPPEKSLILLVCNAPGRLLPTILSRCQKLPLLKMPDEQVVELLKARFPEISEQDADALAIMADGSPGRAIEYAGLDGLKTYEDMIELFAMMPQLKASKLHKLASYLSEKKNEAHFKIFCTHYPQWLGAVARHSAAKSQFPALNEAEASLAKHFATVLGIEKLISLCQNAQEKVAQTIGLNLDKKQMIIGLYEELKSSFAKS